MYDNMMLILGLIICVFGIINIRGNISTIHFYNRSKVAKEDEPKYGKVMGIGTLIIGAALIISYFLSYLSEKAAAYIVLPLVIIGVIFMLYAQFKYNKGLF